LVAAPSILGYSNFAFSSAFFHCLFERKFVLIWTPTDQQILTCHWPQLYISEVVIGTAFGVIMGPHCADVFDPRRWAPDTGVITLEVMRVVLAVGLFAIGVELPESYMMKHVRGLVVLVIPTMAIGWFVVAGAYAPLSLDGFPT
jgi:NhaP-type Na+/H+ or K+/H+ antiporter